MRSYGGRATTNRVKKECDKYVLENINDIKYELFKEVTQENFRQAEAVILYALSLHGYGAVRLNRIHGWMLDLLGMPDMFGKTPTVQDCMKHMNGKYGINFDEVSVKLESKTEFDRR